MGIYSSIFVELNLGTKEATYQIGDASFHFTLKKKRHDGKLCFTGIEERYSGKSRGVILPQLNPSNEIIGLSLVFPHFPHLGQTNFVHESLTEVNALDEDSLREHDSMDALVMSEAVF